MVRRISLKIFTSLWCFLLLFYFCFISPILTWHTDHSLKCCAVLIEHWTSHSIDFQNTSDQLRTFKHLISIKFIREVFYHLNISPACIIITFILWIWKKFVNDDLCPLSQSVLLLQELTVTCVLLFIFCLVWFDLVFVLQRN